MSKEEEIKKEIEESEKELETNRPFCYRDLSETEKIRWDEILGENKILQAELKGIQETKKEIEAEINKWAKEHNIYEEEVRIDKELELPNERRVVFGKPVIEFEGKITVKDIESLKSRLKSGEIKDG